MRILKITDGFVTNSSSANALVIIAYKKDKDLAELLEKIGIPGYQSRWLENDREWIQESLIEEGMSIDQIEKYRKDYELLLYCPAIEVYGDCEVDETELRYRLYDDMHGVRMPRKLVGDDLILLLSEFIGM